MINYIDIIDKNLIERPDKTAYIFLKDGENPESSITYAALQSQSRLIAKNILKHTSTGDRVLLLFPLGIDYVLAFFACLQAGVIAVPAYPPRSHKRSFGRLDSIFLDCKPTLLLTCETLVEQFGEQLFAPLTSQYHCQSMTIEQLNQINTNANESDLADSELPNTCDPDAIAFLQYTSGSTGDPKGVMVSHQNLIKNEQLIQQAFGHSSDSVIVGWLPLFHDMGLVGNLLQPFFVGATAILMSPAAFVQKPIRWLQAISKYRADSSGGPNFAYRLCVEKITEEQLQGLDLSCWKVAFSGSEKVQANTLRAFAQHTQSCGFAFEHFFPCYGMAETTLFVSGARAEAKIFSADPELLARHQYQYLEQGIELVGAGRAENPQMLAIVDTTTGKRLADHQIGEIWVQDDSVAQGYWNKPALTDYAFHASLDDAAGHWLRTGDLGFLSQHELVITGRIKEMVIVRGRNFYPQDIEQTVLQSDDVLQVDATAVFTIEQDNQESLVIVQEIKRAEVRGLDAAAVIRKIKKQVIEQHEIEVFDIVLIRPLSILKTTSGKIQRLASKTAYLEGKLKVLAGLQTLTRNRAVVTAPTAQLSEFESSVVAFLAHFAKLDANAIRLADGLHEIALNSVKMLELQYQIQAHFAVRLSLIEIVELDNIADLCALLQDKIQQLPTPDAQAMSSANSSTEHPGDLLVGSNQRGICFEQYAQPDSCKYNLASAFELSEQTSAQRLSETVKQQLHNHPLLKSRFSLSKDDFVLEYVDHEGVFTVHAATNRTAIEAAISTLALTPFLLEQHSLYQVHYWQLNETTAIVLVLIHHVIADAVSLQQLATELVTGKVSVTDAASDYQQFLLNQRKPVQSDTATVTAPQSEPLNLPHEQGLLNQGAQSHLLTINAQLSDRLMALASRYKTTMNHVLQSAFALTVSRYSQQPNVTIGMPASLGRAHPFEQTIGYFIDPVVMSYQLSQAQSFSSLISGSKTDFYQCLEPQTQTYSEKMASSVGSDSQAGENLYQAMFTYLQPQQTISSGWLTGEGGQTLTLGDQALTSIAVPTGGLLGELDLYLVEREIISGKLVYNSHIWQQATAAQFIDDYLLLLEAICGDEKPLWQLFDVAEPSLTQQPTQSAPLPTQPVPLNAHSELDLLNAIAAQVHQQPEHIAVRDTQGEQLSYAQLWQHSGALAQALVDHNIGADVNVAIYMEATVARMVAIIAVLRAGGAYVPLDKQYPLARNQHILAGSAAALILVDEVDEQLASPTMQWDQAQVAGLPGVNFIAGVYPPTRLAFNIFTSGSTGQPKGVGVSYDNLNQLFAWTSQQYSAAQLDQVLAATSQCFDISLFELLMPLTMGGTVHLLDSMLAIEQLSGRDQITLINSVPSAVQALLDNDLLPPNLTTVNLAGEPLSRNLVAQLKAHNVNQIFNLYGPSEDTVYSTFADVTACQGKPLIGQPISGTQGYILDQWLNPVPHGAIGELFLGGKGVTRGYITSAQMTAEQYLPDPFSAEAGRRMYRTGDLVRRQRNGEIEFIGRSDTMMKLRGQRIELEEIESTLLLIDDIEHCVVCVKRQQLIAYIVAHGEQEPLLNSQSWRTQLAKTLPDYMLPAQYVVIDSIPLLANGKVDTKALSAYQFSRQYQPVRTPLESQLAAIWADVLQLESVGRDASFFELGGHSLLLLQIKHRVETEFALDVTIADLMTVRTVADLALWIEEQQNNQTLMDQLTNPSGEQSQGDDDGDDDFEEFVL